MCHQQQSLQACVSMPYSHFAPPMAFMSAKALTTVKVSTVHCQMLWLICQCVADGTHAGGADRHPVQAG